MKKFFTTAFAVAVVAAAAGEREDLLKKFEQEYAAAQTEFSEKAETTVELVGAAGECSTLSEKHLLQAFNYKLRHTPNRAERLQIVADFYKLSREIEKLHQTPREGMGSLAGMQIYHAEAELMRQQLSVWMLDSEDEKRWKRIADASLILDGKKIKLDRGKASFKSVMDNKKVKLEFLLFPGNTFTWQKRMFAIIRIDIPFSGNDDFSTVYLFELIGGVLNVHTRSRYPYVSRWELRKNKLVLYYLKNNEKIVL